MITDIEARLRDQAVTEWGETAQASLEWEATDTIAALRAQLAEEAAKVCNRRAAFWRERQLEMPDTPCGLPLEEECEDCAIAIRSKFPSDESY